MKFFSQAIVSLGLLAAAVVPAGAWDIDKMNEQIEKTSVIVSEICSGTIIDVEERLVLTAHHCITDNLREIEKKETDPITGEIKIIKIVERTPMFIETWNRQDYDVVTAERHRVTIKGYDQATDIAVLQVVDKDWKPSMEAPLARSSFEFKRGLTVFAVGNPGIEYDNSLTQGIISAPERALDFGTGKIPMFQHSATIIGGSSGGAIYNDSGEIIGTISAGVRGAAIGFAVPITKTKDLLKKLGLQKVYE